MLCRTVIVALLVASLSILRVQAWGWGHTEEKALPNESQTPSYVGRAGIDALTIQDGNVYQTGPNDQNMYGSITQEKIGIYDSPDSSQPSSIHTRTAFAPGGPGKQGVSYARLDGAQSQGQPDQNQNPSNGGTIQHGSYTYQKGNKYNLSPNSNRRFGSLTEYTGQVFKSDGGQIPTGQNNIQYGSQTIQTGNTYNLDSTGNYSFGSRTVQKGNVYMNRKEANNTQDSAKAQAHSQEHKEPKHN